jgi:uncharacterized membrane protein (DUF485 family)
MQNEPSLPVGHPNSPLSQSANVAATETPHHDDHHELISSQSRTGIGLFLLYFIFYAIFMGIAAFQPKLMAQETVFGPNLAIVYGFGLIIGAVGVALLYMIMSQRNLSQFHARNRQLKK